MLAFIKGDLSPQDNHTVANMIDYIFFGVPWFIPFESKNEYILRHKSMLLCQGMGETNCLLTPVTFPHFTKSSITLNKGLYMLSNRYIKKLQGIALLLQPSA